jgi:predicted PhzF superfamily epimerase YddE/YHI9
MQAVSAENNVSETAFVERDGEGYKIRWFTPTVEVDLCGHATLAAAHVIFDHLAFTGETVGFSSRSGMLYVRRKEGYLYLDFPADTIMAVDPPAGIREGVGIEPVGIYRGRDDYLLVFDREGVIASLSPKMEILARIPARGVIVSAPGTTCDFVSRFFAPQAGVPEDPVTGSAHTTLVPYWSERLGKRELTARQLSERGGKLVCKDLGERVEIGGQAVTYLIGEIFL